MSADIKSLAMTVLQRHAAVSIESQPLEAGETTVRLPEISPVAGLSAHAAASPGGVELPARAEKLAPGTSAGACPTSASARCGGPHCAGCYPVIHPEGGETVYIHPPKPSQDWLDWLARWKKPKGERVQ